MFRSILLILSFSCLPGCLSSIALERAVLAYDQATTDIVYNQLLLNIARAHQHRPLHFTGVSSIAATFNFQFNAGATPALTGDKGGLLTPVFGGTISENPTISILPMEGEEFTKRLLTPFHESKLTMLIRQGADVDLVLRLLASELRIYGTQDDASYLNKPSDQTGYKFFRQAVLHISAIQDMNALHVEPIFFDQNWKMRAETMTPEQLANLQKDFIIGFESEKGMVSLSKRTPGHIIISNYNLASLSNEERILLQNKAQMGANNEVIVDIRPGFPGGEWPMYGAFRLRSFYNVLNFIGQSLSEDPEYNIEKRPVTPMVKENPVQTLGLIVAEDKPDTDDLSINYGNLYYAIKPEAGYQWNREAFRLLYQIFQMTISELPQQNAPLITISK